jgi:hypothetical protein
MGTSIPAAGGGVCTEDAWLGAVTALVAAKAPTVVNVCLRSKCATLLAVELAAGTVNGTGSSITQDTTRNGGVIINDCGANANAFNIMKNAGGVPLVTNPKTAKWAVATRVLIGTVVATTTMDVCGLSDNTTYDVSLGVNGPGSTANWAIFVTGQTTQNTGVALPTATFATVCLIADGTNLSAWNVDTGVQIGTSVSQANVGTANAVFKQLTTNTAGGSNKLFTDDIAVITEPAA